MFDVAIVSMALMITTPLFLIIAMLIKIDSEGRVFFIQERAGKSGKPFKFLKFRTMVENAEHIGLGKLAAEDDPRITRTGKFLRGWTLDELPQFINILRGEMSLVGPRPVPMYQIQQYNDFQKRRLEVPPGLISIVDIKGRNLVPWEKRFEYDAWYVDHQSLWLDLKILFIGFFAVISRRGIYGEGGVNKPPK